MKKIYSLILLNSLSILVHGQLLFERVYGEASPTNALPYQNGYLIFSNHSGVTGTLNNSSFVTRTDLAGDTIWSKPTLGAGLFNGVVDSNSAITILQNYDSAGFVTLMQMVRLDSNGNILRKKLLFPFAPNDSVWFHGAAICGTNDSGFLITGYWDSIIYYRRFIIKTDSLFNIQAYYGDNLDGAQTNSGNILETSTGDIIVYGHLGYGGPSTPFSELLKVDSSFQFKWKKNFGDCRSNSLYEDDNGNYVIAGSEADPMSGPPPPYHGFVTKLDTAGNIIWQKTDSTYFCNICKGPGNGVLVAGYDFHYASTNSTSLVFVRAYDSAGNFVFNRYFNPSYYGYTASIQSVGDSTFVLSGIVDTVIGSPFNVKNLYLIVSDYNQSFIASIPQLNSEELQLFPNPASDLIFISKNEKIISIDFFNSQGEIALKVEAPGNESGIDISDLKDGIYFAKICSASKKYTFHKLIVVR